MTESSDTLYLKNLDDSVRSNELRRTLYLLACEYGPVLDVALHKNEKGRGQAWITFTGREAAVRALQGLNDLSIYGKQIRAQNARSKPSVGKKR